MALNYWEDQKTLSGVKWKRAFQRVQPISWFCIAFEMNAFLPSVTVHAYELKAPHGTYLCFSFRAGFNLFEYAGKMRQIKAPRLDPEVSLPGNHLQLLAKWYIWSHESLTFKNFFCNFSEGQWQCYYLFTRLDRLSIPRLIWNPKSSL